MYIAGIKIVNFQCHADLELAFGPGLNAIVGESDRGKTAILRAIRWVLFNQPDGQAFRKEGTRETRVTLTFDNGLRVSRTRSKQVNRYEVERPGEAPVALDNFGKDVPVEVLHATGIHPAEFRREGFSVELSFGGQFSPPFLLTESGIVRAQVLGYLSRTTILDTASKSLNAEIREVGTSIVEDERERDRLRDEVHRYDDLEGLGERLAALEADVARLAAVEGTIHSAAVIVNRMESLRNGLEQQQRQLARLQDLPSLDALELHLANVEKGERLAGSIERAGLELSTARAQLKRVEAAAEVEVTALAGMGEAYERAADLNRRAQAWKASYLAECEKLERLEADLRQRIDELLGVLRAERVCPTCFGPMTEETLQRVQAELLGA